MCREGVGGQKHADEEGGLSGAPVFDKSNEVLSALRRELPESIALIGVGGIVSGERAAEKIRLGADLVQFYTGFVYEGPGLIADSVKAIAGLETSA